MVQFTQIATANASAFLLLMIVKIHMNQQGKKNFLPDEKLLAAMIDLTMFQCFFDTLVFWIDGKLFPSAISLNYIGNIIYYSINITISYLWTLFTEYKLNSSSIKMKRLAIIMGVPLAIVVLLVASAPWNGFIFTITEENLYTRTSWHFLIPTMLIVFYLFRGTLRIYIHRGNQGKYMIFPAIYFITPVTIAMLAQNLHYGISLIFIGIAIGLTGIYLSAQNESAYIDPLCGVYNRRYYHDYICALCNSGNKGKIIGALLDMDDFKSINDCYGHSMGDEVLKQFSAILRSCMDGLGFVVRYGGDEFILIAQQPDLRMEEVVAAIEKETEAANAADIHVFRLAFSYGIAEIPTDIGSEKFLQIMDAQMYEMKKRKKGRQQPFLQSKA